MGSRVILDEECCVGCGSCAELCPDVFEMDDEAEKAHVINAEGGSEECMEEAVVSCPGNCISRE